MDFLLECVGFPPEHPLREIVDLAREVGEPAAWRGDPATHRVLKVAGGLELLVDRDVTDRHWNVLPLYRSDVRLRVAVDELRRLEDSRFDALLVGFASPPVHAGEAYGHQLGEERAGLLTLHDPGAYPIAVYLTDARRLPRDLPFGHVLAVTLAGFALDVEHLGPNEDARDPSVLERESGASIEPLGGHDDPGGCAELSVRIQEVVHLVNPFTQRAFDLLRVDAPERPLTLFVSRWQLEREGWPYPRPGLRIEGTFLFTGRVAGGLRGPRSMIGPRFG